MKNLRDVLEDADPLRSEPSLPAADARDISRRILAAAETPVLLTFPRALPVAALVVVMIVAGMIAGRRFAAATPATDSDAAAVQLPGEGERRQVRFATPGGTRIIWTIDPNFHMRGTLP